MTFVDVSPPGVPTVTSGSSVVGSSPWDDGSDSTYTLMRYETIDFPDTIADCAFTAAPTATAIDFANAKCRVSSDAGNPAFESLFNMGLRNTIATNFAFASNQTISPGTPATDFTFPISSNSWALPALQAGELVVFVSGFLPLGPDVPGNNYWFSIYEVLLPVAFGSATTYLRAYPRTDGVGPSAAPRLWPPARSAQGSNRVAGGTYY